MGRILSRLLFILCSLFGSLILFVLMCNVRYSLIKSYRKTSLTSQSHIAAFNSNVFESFKTSNAETDSLYTFIFKEEPPPFLILRHSNIMFGMNRLEDNSAKFCFLFYLHMRDFS